MSHRDTSQFIRFCLVGVLSTAIHIAVSLGLEHWTGLSIEQSSAGGFLTVVTINYLLHRHWTFRSSRDHRSAIPRFAATTVGGLSINYLTVATAHSRFGDVIALLLGIAIVVIWNYSLSRLWVFVEHSEDI